MTVRLRNTLTGAVVSTTEETAARLGVEWERVTPTTEPTTPRPRRRPTTKK